DAAQCAGVALQRADAATGEHRSRCARGNAVRRRFCPPRQLAGRGATGGGQVRSALADIELGSGINGINVTRTTEDTVPRKEDLSVASTTSLRLVRNDLDLDLRIHHQLGLRRGPRGFVAGKDFGVHAVEGPEIARVVEPDGSLHDVAERASRQRERALDGFPPLPRLRPDAAGNDFAVLAHRHLARYEHEGSRLDRRREWQRLSTRARTRTTKELDAHAALLVESRAKPRE